MLKNELWKHVFVLYHNKPQAFSFSCETVTSSAQCPTDNCAQSQKYNVFWILDDSGGLMLSCDSSVPLCLPADMIPENALEEMTKNMDPNLVIVEAKEGVQMK